MMSNFTSVKLIFPFIFIFYLTVFSFPENSSVSSKYFAQISTSKTSFQSKDIINNNGTDEDSLQSFKAETGEDSLQLKRGEQILANPNAVQQNPKPDESKVKSELQNNKDHQKSLLTGRKLVRIFFNDKKVENFKNELITYGENHVPQYFGNFYLKLVDKFFQYPIIFVFIVLILFFIVNIICVLLILNYTIKRKNQKAIYIRNYGRMYEEALLSYIFGEIEWEEVLVKLKMINKHQNRKILTSVLLNFYENLKGEVDKFIPEIFYNLGLHKDSFKSVKSSFTYRKVQGIRELTYLYPKGAIEIVPGYVDYHDDVVRAEAQMAYIRLNENNPFAFLSSLTKPLARWTQLSAFYLIRLYQLPVPSFADYLYSKHSTVRNFCLQMITYFQQLENVSEIFDMMKNGVERTRFLCYKAINDLRLYEGRVPLRKNYRNETYRNKLEIIKAFKNIGTEEDFQFLEVIIKSESVSLKLEACRTMYFMNQEGCERLIKLSKESNPEIEQIIAHITDPRN